MFQSYVDHFTSKDVHNPQNLCAVLWFGFNTDERHFTFDGLISGEITQLNDIYQFAQLLHNLFQHGAIGFGGQRNS